MIKYILGFLAVFLFCVVYTDNIYSQTLEEAKVLYTKGQYAKALPAFEKAIKSAPNNSSYNQWYGNCLLETGKIVESEKYLKVAASKNIKESFRSLGKLYFIQYRFKESEEAYEKYLVFLRKEKQSTEIKTIEELSRQSKEAARMLAHCEDIQIIDSIILDKSDFLKAYGLSKESGTLSGTNNMVIYENQLQDKRYYSKIDDKKKYRLYTQSKLMNKWTEETLLNLPATDDDDNNYPFILSDGVTVYYASTGQGSIGGYDLFITRYNSASNTYFKPEQLGMPFNSPYNDYMLALDEYNGIGYFATDRFQREGKVVVYTFVPNEEKTTIETEDKSYLISRAKITSIRQSQKKEMDYAARLKQIKSEQQKKQEEISREFEFVINDNIIYYKLDDFKSHAARQLFIQYQSLRNQLDLLNRQLDDKRKVYKEGNTAKKTSLSKSILSDEKKSEEMTIQSNESAVKIRNTEIKHLKSF